MIKHLKPHPKSKIFLYRIKDILGIFKKKKKRIRNEYATVLCSLLYYDVENSNGRIYSKECAKDIIKQFKNNDFCVGELGFPEESFVVSLGRVSHIVNEIHLNKKNKSIDGTIEILDTPQGNILLEQLNSLGGAQNFNNHFAVRSRGIGIKNPKTKKIKNFELISFDIIPKSKDPFNEIEKKYE